MTQQELELIDHRTTTDKRVIDMALNCWHVLETGNGGRCNTCDFGICSYDVWDGTTTAQWRANQHISRIVDKLR